MTMDLNPMDDQDSIHKWNLYRLGKLARIVTGSTPDTSNPENFGSALPWVTPGDLKGGKYVRTSDRGLSAHGAQSVRRVPAGSILLTCIGSTIGKSAIAERDMSTNQQINAIIATNVDANYLFYAIDRLAARIAYLANKQAVPILNKGSLTGLKLAVPESREAQKRIAELLSTWDHAIDQLDKLIDAKTRHRNAVAHQLLTGRVRFSEFVRSDKVRQTKFGPVPADWEVVKLGDVLAERKETAREDLPLLAITAGRGIVPRDDLDRRDTSPEDKSRYKRIAPGDIGYNTMRMWQGVSGLSALEGIVSPAYTVVTPRRNCEATFAAYLFKHPAMVFRFWRFSQGLVDDTLGLKYGAFAAVPAVIPSSIEEQTAIATAIGTAEMEIERLGALRANLDLQKRGLMQKLLTGQWTTGLAGMEDTHGD